MKNKLIKYIKIFTCLVIVLWTAIFSYGALSASDGSAFVTIAEFDSVIADFNDRITTFENGIDNKIDLQVSEYISKNGVWGGNKIIQNRLILIDAWTTTNLNNFLDAENYSDIVKDFNGGKSLVLKNKLEKSGLFIGKVSTGNLKHARSNRDTGTQDIGGGGDLVVRILQDGNLVIVTKIGSFGSFGSMTNNDSVGFHWVVTHDHAYNIIGFLEGGKNIETDVFANTSFSAPSKQDESSGRLTNYAPTAEAVVLESAIVY